MKTQQLAAFLLCGSLLAGCGGKKVHTSRVNLPRPAAPGRHPSSPPAPPAHIPQAGETETGVASWYGEPYHGRRAANGEIYDMEQLTAAHRTLPFDTWVRVTNQANGRSVDVRITDRGPFVGDRIIDLSRAAAREVAMLGPGLAQVRIVILQAPESAPVLGLFGVQVGSFRNKDSALLLRERLMRQYGNAQAVQRADTPGLWRVVVGGCQTMERAGQLASRLRSEFTAAYVVRTEAEPGVAPSCPEAPEGRSENSDSAQP